MKNKMKQATTALTMKKMADKMATVACASASIWGMHQIKEPKAKRKA